MSIYAALKGVGPSGFGYGSTAEEVTADIDLDGRVVVITGCNSGLGAETMRVLGSRGAELVAVARTTDKASAAAREAGVEATPVACDLSEPRSASDAAKTIADLGKPIGAVIANAGIMALPKLHVKHGLELQFLTNHMGHFILVTGLLDSLADDARVVMLSSSAHGMAPKAGIELDNLDGSRGYNSWRAYGQSKLANLLFARQLAADLKGTSKTANAVHPGVIKTNLTRHMNPLTGIAMTIAGPLGLKSVGEGAATQCYVATHPSLAEVSGEYFKDCNVAKSSGSGRNLDLAKSLWDRSEELAAELLA
ncbi:MAG: SDR family NAD(P)-dependent oxidoreductase [Deltaproteobacteria bacterium]|nr:SDR family NAD(P)-dependent oxidoreductase [Deltaproteobacteria bacterium]